MADEVTSQDAIESAVMMHLQQEYENAAILTGWVVIAEFMTAEGNPAIYAFAADHMPYWKVNGMLDAAPHEMGYMYAGEEEDEDEEI